MSFIPPERFASNGKSPLSPIKTNPAMSSLSVIYDKNMLDLEIKKGELLGQKGANKQLYLYKSCHACAVLLEIGRLREKTFRLMGLGTGKTYDLDNYDFYYDHLILWDDHEKIIIGAYRLMPCAEVLETLKSDVEPPLYTQTIFQYSETFREEYFSQTVEIGRIFIRSSHWGTSSLNYLWFGMAYYFARVPALKYFLCALSIPAEFSDAQKSVMVNFLTSNLLMVIIWQQLVTLIKLNVKILVLAKSLP